MPENPYQPPKEVNKPRQTKSPLAIIGTTSLIGLLVGMGIGCAGILLLPTRSADGLSVYNWSFVVVVVVALGLIAGFFTGISRILDSR